MCSSSSVGNQGGYKDSKIIEDLADSFGKVDLKNFMYSPEFSTF